MRWAKQKARVIFLCRYTLLRSKNCHGTERVLIQNEYLYFLHSTYGITAWNEGTWGLHKDAFNNCRCWDRYIWCT